jgi:hypothetical protein
MAVVAALVCFALWASASRFQSPAQVEAATKPPAASPVTATVERASLTDTFTVVAKLTREHEMDATSSVEGVVTAVNPSLQSGDVAAGSWLLAVNDRPIFMLQGEFPLFRDLVWATRGNDVTMVQTALRSAGYTIAQNETGRVGPSTQAAFARLYRSSGYPSPEPAPEATAEVDTARAALQEAQSADPLDLKAVEAAKARLGLAEQVAGPALATNAVLVSPYASASVQLSVGVGSKVVAGGPLAELRTGAPMWSASLPPSVADGLDVGKPCTIDVGGQSFDSSILTITAPTAAAEAPAVGAPPDPGTPTDVEIRIGVPPGVQPDPADALVTIDRSTIQGEHLVVPATAVVSRGERSYVAILDGGRWKELPVTVIGELGGRVAVDAAGLAEGDQVRVAP